MWEENPFCNNRYKILARLPGSPNSGKQTADALRGRVAHMLRKSTQARLLERFVIMTAKKPISLGFVGTIGSLLKQTFSEWLADKAPNWGGPCLLHGFFTRTAGHRFARRRGVYLPQ
jgi:hypothetical protein